MDANQSLREHLIKLLNWKDAHCGFDKAVDGLSPEKRGVTPTDCLTRRGNSWSTSASRSGTFSISAATRITPRKSGRRLLAQRSGAAERCGLGFERRRRSNDRNEFSRLAADTEVNLFAAVPAGDGQTFLREILLAADHMSYHVGQIVYVRRLLGAWD